MGCPTTAELSSCACVSANGKSRGGSCRIQISAGASGRLALSNGMGTVAPRSRPRLRHARRHRQGEGHISSFLTFWKDAVPDTPILKQTKVEYAKLE